MLRTTQKIASRNMIAMATSAPSIAMPSEKNVRDIPPTASAVSVVAIVHAPPVPAKQSSSTPAMMPKSAPRRAPTFAAYKTTAIVINDGTAPRKATNCANIVWRNTANTARPTVGASAGPSTTSIDRKLLREDEDTAERAERNRRFDDRALIERAGVGRRDLRDAADRCAGV